MKRLIFLFVLTPLLSIGQSRFNIEFSKADSAFMYQAKSASIQAAYETDSILKDRTNILLYQWIKYVKECEKPYYKDTVVKILDKGCVYPELFYVKKYRSPSFIDFWDRYLKDNKIIKFE